MALRPVLAAAAAAALAGAAAAQPLIRIASYTGVTETTGFTQETGVTVFPDSSVASNHTIGIDAFNPTRLGLAIDISDATGPTSMNVSVTSDLPGQSEPYPWGVFQTPNTNSILLGDGVFAIPFDVNATSTITVTACSDDCSAGYTTYKIIVDGDPPVTGSSMFALYQDQIFQSRAMPNGGIAPTGTISNFEVFWPVATDALSGIADYQIAYSWGSGAFASAVGVLANNHDGTYVSVPLADPPPGVHWLKVYAVDAAGNPESGASVLTFAVSGTVDDCPSYVYYAKTCDGTVYPKTTSTTLQGSTGVIPSVYTDGPSDYSALVDDDGVCDHCLHIAANDTYGNISPYDSTCWTQNNAKPSCDIDESSLAPLNGYKAQLTLTAEAYGSVHDAQMAFEASLNDAAAGAATVSAYTPAAGTADPINKFSYGFTLALPANLGQNTLAFTPYDSFGNKGDACTVEWNTTCMDTSATTSWAGQHTTGTGGKACDRTGNVTVTPTGFHDRGANDIAVYEYEYKVGDGPWVMHTQANAPTFSLTGLPEGETHVLVRAMEGAASCADPEPFELTLCVDTVAPKIHDIFSADVATGYGVTGSDTPTISWDIPSNETALVSYDITILRGNTQVQNSFGYTQPPGTFGETTTATSFTTNALTVDGSYTFRIVPTDLAGNVGESSEYYFVLDTGAPDTKITMPPPSPTKELTVMVGVTSPNEAGSTFSYSLSYPDKWAKGTPIDVDNIFGDDASDYAASPLEVTVDGPGVYTLSVVAKDVAGNVDTSPAYFSFTVLPSGEYDTYCDECSFVKGEVGFVMPDAEFVHTA